MILTSSVMVKKYIILVKFLIVCDCIIIFYVLMLFHFLNIQGFHLGKVPEGSISQFADAVSLQLEDLQAGQTLEGQTLHLTYTVPVQFTAGDTHKQTKKETDHGRKISKALTSSYLNHCQNMPYLAKQKKSFFSLLIEEFLSLILHPSITLKSKPKNPAHFSWKWRNL